MALIRFAHLCDYGLVSQDGKVSVLGIFSQIGTRSLPAVHPRSYLAFEIQISPAEVGRPMKLRIEMVGTDGEPGFRLETEFTAQGPRIPGRPLQIGQVLALPPLQIMKPGPHAFNFFINEDLKYTVDFLVELALPAATP